MRRPMMLGLAACAAGVLIAAGSLLTPTRFVPAAVWLLGRGLGIASHAAVCDALAQGTLEFRPVSPESATALERPARTRHRRAEAAAPTADADSLTRLEPVPPEPEPVPGVPAVPRLSRSGEMMRIWSDIHIDEDQTVQGDVLALGGDVTVDGHVQGDVVAMGGDVYLNSTSHVDGDVVCIGGELHEKPGAIVGGQRVTAPGRTGRRHHAAFPRVFSHIGRFVGTLVALLVTLLITWVVLKIAPARSTAALDSLKREPGHALGIGFVTALLIGPSFIALAIVAALLCVTIIGIPVAVAVLLGYPVVMALLLLWGFAVGAAALGHRIAARMQTGVVAMVGAALWGIVAIFGVRAVGHLIGMVPGLGFFGGFLVVLSWVATGLVTMFGCGALLRAEFATGTLGRWWRGPAYAAPASGAASSGAGAGMTPGASPAAVTPPAPLPPVPPPSESSGPPPPA